MTSPFLFINNFMEKILFLDIDGVLNSKSYLDTVKMDRETLISELVHFYKDEKTPYPSARTLAVRLVHLDQDKVEMLTNIVKKTNCKIVLSSSWRMGNTAEQMQYCLEQKDSSFPKNTVIDTTTKEILRIRGDEIDKWIKDNNFKGTYCVVDDEEKTYDYQPRVTTLYSVGMTSSDATEIIKKLNRK